MLRRVHICLSNLLFRFSLFFISLWITACQSNTEWEFEETISLGEIPPIGIAYNGTNFWISDGDHNQLVEIDKAGTVLQTLKDFRRPMHIAFDNGKLYVPEYGKDSITIINGAKTGFLNVDFELDAPAGVAIAENGDVAIADFYNHRLLLRHNDVWKSVGKKGRNAASEFHYPTDVHYTKDALYVADAYNNRIQVFDLEGTHLRTFGRPDKMNAATGIYVWNDQVLVTDFENDRVLIYVTKGTLLQTLTEGLSNPTDLIVVDGRLYVINYKGQSMVRFKR